jgi:hypothetical protein
VVRADQEPADEFIMRKRQLLLLAPFQGQENYSDRSCECCDLESCTSEDQNNVLGHLICRQ